jgi:hypothetical protein
MAQGEEYLLPLLNRESPMLDLLRDSAENEEADSSGDGDGRFAEVVADGVVSIASLPEEKMNTEAFSNDISQRLEEHVIESGEEPDREYIDNLAQEITDLFSSVSEESLKESDDDSPEF